MTDYLMILVIGCVVVIGIAYRVRRDMTGPELTDVSKAVFLGELWSSLPLGSRRLDQRLE